MNNPRIYQMLFATLLLIIAALILDRFRTDDLEKKFPNLTEVTPLTKSVTAPVATRPASGIETGKSGPRLTLSYIKDYKPKQDSHYDTQLGPYRIVGRGGDARILNIKGESIATSPANNTFFNLAVSPNKNQIAASMGDGESRIIDLQKGSFFDLSAVPPGINRLGFSPWSWITDDLLVATSGIQALDSSGKPVSCCGGHNEERTLLYSYTVSDRQLLPVEIPPGTLGSVFSINRIGESGEIELVPTQTHLSSGSEPRSVWFKMEVR
jgi:hypothetical protein